MLPAILLVELNVPLTVFYTKLPTPLVIPIPPSIGPLINPSIGLSNKSYIPLAKCLTNPTGLPNISIDPKTLSNN